MDVALSPLPRDHFTAWHDAARERMISRNLASGMRVGDDAEEHVDRMLTQLFAAGYPSQQCEVFLIVEGDKEIGSLLLWRSGSRVVVLDAQFPVHATDDHACTVIELVRTRAVAAGADVLGIEVFGQDTAMWNLVERGDWQPSSIQMILDPLPPRSVAKARVSLRPMSPERFAEYVRGSIESFAAELMTAGKMTPAEAAAESRDQFDNYLPQGLDTAGQFLYTADIDGSEIGIVWFGAKPRGSQELAFILDIEIAPEHRAKGYGRAAMLAAEHEADKLGMTSMGLHVFATNRAAVTLYESLGYERVQEYLVMDAR